MDTKRLVAFLKGLKAHNNKAWFDAHRDEYEPLRQDFFEFVQRVILDTARFDPALRNLTAKEAVYRINRDIRFSKDKTPYKTSFGAGIGPGGKKGNLAGYHFGINEQGKVFIAGGLHMPEPNQLEAIRQSIARQPKKFTTLINAPAFKKQFGSFDGERLKKAPRGFDPDHPLVEYLKLKQFAVWTDIPVSRLPKKNPEQFVADQFKVMAPFVLWLRAVSA
ncbi:MAG: DUF2461 domain-containing protein [Candidatus Kerfeldbacteria bacterium]|nr:DUF2461 domain-containing protein [Candidatus Kerfeldbacteria bacterium]